MPRLTGGLSTHQPRALRALLLVIVSAGTLTGLAAAPASAADDGNTSFAPADRPDLDLEPFFELEVNPGVRVRDRVVLENRSEQPQTYDIYPADAASVGGAFTLSGADAEPTGCGRLAGAVGAHGGARPLGVPHLRLHARGPGERDARGDQARGIVALPRTTQAVDGSSNVQLQARHGVGVRVYVRVGGLLHSRADGLRPEHRPSGRPSGNALLGADSATVGYQVENSGNVTLEPTTNGQVSTLTSTIDLTEGQLGEMLPGSPKVVVKEKVKGLRWGSLTGRVRAKVTVTADGAQPVTREVTVWRVPWLSLVGMGSTVAMIGGFWFVRRRNRLPAVNLAIEEATSEAMDPVAH